MQKAAEDPKQLSGTPLRACPVLSILCPRQTVKPKLLKWYTEVIERQEKKDTRYQIKDVDLPV